MSQNNFYNKKDVYDKEIQPIIQQLKNACHCNQMPMFVTVAVTNTPEETIYESEMIYANSHVSLTKKNLPSLLLLLNDFQTELPQKVRHSIAVIEDYYANLGVDIRESSFIKNEAAGVQLTENLIDKMNGVINGNDSVQFPSHQEK